MDFKDALDAVRSGATVYSKSVPHKLLTQSGHTLTYNGVDCSVSMLAILAELKRCFTT